jgi:hypothetical protein
VEAAKQEESKSQSSSATNSQTSSKPAAKSAPAKKGSLFNSFAKAKPKAKAPAAPEPAAQDMVLDDASEEEAEELFPDSTDKTVIANRESRKEREARLKKMMDDDEADGMFPILQATGSQLTSTQTKKCPMPTRSQNGSPRRLKHRRHPSQPNSKNKSP